MSGRIGEARIHVTGASGAGVSTLGARLAERLFVRWLDTDDIYWLPTDPPFTAKRSIPDRIALMRARCGTAGWVVSGSLDGWGDPIVADADLVVFVDTPADLRLDRLRRRESERFGARIAPGGDMHEDHEAFIVWAAGYDAGGIEGRNRPRHERWLAGLSMPVVRVDGSRPVEHLVDAVLSTPVLGRAACADRRDHPAATGPDA